MGDMDMILFIIVFASFSLKTVLGQCTDAETIIGLANTGSKTNKDYDGDADGVNSVLTTDNKYRFTCCGFISKWEVYARNGLAVPKDVTLQVWEQDGTTTTYNKIGENVITVDVANSKNQKTVTGNRIRVNNGQQMGFYEHDGSVITYSGGTGFCTRQITSTQTTFIADDTLPGTIECANNRDHAIQAIVVPSVAPSFSDLDDTVNIANTATGTIYTLTVSDTDVEDTTLTVTPTNSGSFELITLTSTTYEVSVQTGATLTAGTSTITFTVADACGQSSNGVLTIVITNPPPVITSLQTSNNKTISEDENVGATSDVILHTLIVDDADPITCELTTTGVPFTVTKPVGSANYGIYLLSGGALDYTVTSEYELDLICSDTVTDTPGTFTVYLTMNQPPSIQLLPLSKDMSEDTTSETTLHTFTITDPENADVSCTVPTTVPASLTTIFIKPSGNKNEYHIILQSNPNLVYDTRRMYKLTIECSDNRRSDSSVFFMYVTRNQPPVFVNLQNTTVISGRTAYIGQNIFTADYTDNESDEVTFVMTCSSPADATAVSPFKIFQSGDIVLDRDISTETVPGYDCYITINDSKSTTGPRSLTIHVTELNNIPMIMNLPLPSNLVVLENTNLGETIFPVSIQDKDETDTHTYTMTSNPGEGMSYFTIHPTSGVFTTASNVIDYEGMTDHSIDFTITVSDSMDTDSKNLSITIININEPPTFTKKTYDLSVDEGTAGTTLTAPGYLYSDDDNGDTHTFSMTCANNVGYFAIESATGNIKLATDVDYDITGFAGSFTCTVTISDGALTDTATVTITVNNINDNSPTFNDTFYTVTIPLGQAVGTDFGTVAATDNDAGAFGTFTYSLDQSNLGFDMIGIRTTGALYLKSTLASNMKTYGDNLQFNAVATDAQGSSGTARIYVLIEQTTTAAPTTTQEPYVTFWEHPPNPAWVIVALSLGLISCFIPCYIIYTYPGKCTYKGRPKPLSEKTTEDKQDDRPRQEGNFNPKWKPWFWFQIKNK